MSKFILVIVALATLSACGSGSGGSSNPSLATIANILGTWLASSGNAEDITQIDISDAGDTNSASVFVFFADSTTDVGFLEFTDTNQPNRGVRVQVSSATLTGTVNLSNNCVDMSLTLDGESGNFTQAGNTCTDIEAFELDDNAE